VPGPGSAGLSIHTAETMGVRLEELCVGPGGTAKTLQNLTDELASLSILWEEASCKTLPSEPRFHAPIVVRMAEAIDWLNFSTSDACSASTMIRARGSVPEYRNTMRPLSPRIDSA